MKRGIAFDCDGVLLDFLKEAYRIVAELKNMTEQEVKATQKRGCWDLKERFDLNSYQMNLFWRRVRWQNLCALKRAKEALLVAQEYFGADNVYFVTQLSEKHREKRLHNLQNLFGKDVAIFNENVRFTKHGELKSTMLKTIAVDIFVEDSLSNLFDAAQNSSVKHLIWTESNGERTKETIDNLNRALSGQDYTNEVLVNGITIKDVAVMVNETKTTFIYAPQSELPEAIHNLIEYKNT